MEGRVKSGPTLQHPADLTLRHRLGSLSKVWTSPRESCIGDSIAPIRKLQLCAPGSLSKGHRVFLWTPSRVIRDQRHACGIITTTNEGEVNEPTSNSDSLPVRDR